MPSARRSGSRDDPRDRSAREGCVRAVVRGTLRTDGPDVPLLRRLRAQGRQGDRARRDQTVEDIGDELMAGRCCGGCTETITEMLVVRRRSRMAVA